MAIQLVVIVTCLTVFAAQGSAQQQRPVPPAFTRSGRGRLGAPLELDPEQPVPQPFRRVSVPLYRGRGFSKDGQEPKFAPQQAFQPRPTPQQAFQTGPADDGNESVGRTDGNAIQDDAAAADAEVPRPTRLQGPPLFQSQSATDRADRIQGQQVDRVQQQHVDRVQQQQQPEKPFPSFRPQPQILLQPTPSAEPQPQLVRKIVQRPWQKRVPTTTEENATPVSRSSETVQRVKHERTDIADKQRVKKPVSQVLRRYRDDNPDGSITWGFENDDGTFKEERIGADCVTRGKYGYVDPEGVKREYTYQSGLPCDKNRVPLSAAAAAAASDPSGQPSYGGVQEAQASDTRGYIDYTKNQYVMANGQTISLNGMARNRARKPVVRKTAVTPSAPDSQ